MSDNDCSKNHGVVRKVSLLISLLFIGIPTERAFSLSMSNEQLSMNNVIARGEHPTINRITPTKTPPEAISSLNVIARGTILP
jgi:hypothetical protein